MEVHTWYGGTIWFRSFPTPIETFVMLPRRDILSGEWIWMERAMKLRRILTGPGEPIEDTFYTSEENWMMHCLRMC